MSSIFVSDMLALSLARTTITKGYDYRWINEDEDESFSPIGLGIFMIFKISLSFRGISVLIPCVIKNQNLKSRNPSPMSIEGP